ncbi:cobalamin B12-binding domain-containing protein [Streptomyces spiramenti]|uniref:cobalamin B12-binding domain-containing protein n=1 Tax=Streptomyces spiramenti TaxID=2720606 RepID=UPI00308416AF
MTTETPPGALPERTKPLVLISTVASDAHTWNLVFLQLLVEELGHPVVNLGPCVPEELLAQACREHRPDLLVMSSVNGHGFRDGLSAIRHLRAQPDLDPFPAAIGGKLSTSDSDDPERVRELVEAGFDAVFMDGSAAVSTFRRFLASVERPTGVHPPQHRQWTVPLSGKAAP